MLDTLLKQLNMVRLVVGAVAISLLVGCTGLISGEGDQGLTPEQKAAVDAWVNKALPAFKSATCTTCHGGTQQDIAFLAGDADIKIRDTLIGFSPQVVNIDAPQSSRVLTKGAHAGPALSAQQTSDILEWIQAEASAAGGTGSGSTIMETTPFTVLLCTSGVAGDPTCPINHVDISALPNAPALPGAHIDFVAQLIGSSDTYITDLYATTGQDGLYIEHPLFVYLPPTGMKCPNGLDSPCPDPIDRFFNVKIDMMPTDPKTPLDGGIADFANFAPVQGSQMQLTFKVVDKYRDMSGTGGGGGGGQTGCKVLTGANSFQSLVVPVMNVQLTGEGNKCSNCHMGQNANATSAMDITGIGSTDTSATGPLQTACNQVRTRIDFSNIPSSGVILAPESGQDAAHPFKFANGGNFTSFQTALVNWANAEKVAP
jgi:hypothetical protein